MILTTAERFRRHQRDLAAYQRRSLARRVYPRFWRDLAIVPHHFLLPGQIQMLPILSTPEAVREALGRKAVWTLDTAARRVTGRGFLTAADLTGYVSPPVLVELGAQGLIGPVEEFGITLEPLFHRPPMLFARNLDEGSASVQLVSGERVVPWELLVRDLMGTLGWRPDLLTSLEATYPAKLAESRVKRERNAD
jgi:hypothetical protein